MSGKIKTTLQLRESRSGPVMCLVIFSANGGLVIGRILLGLDGGIHGRGINLVLDTRERVFSPRQWVPRKGSKMYYFEYRLGRCNRNPK